MNPSLLTAVVVGLAFGFVLERTGLADPRRLTGQFASGDFTVFKVMFTAIVTAMLGVYWCSRLGLIDTAMLAFTPVHAVPQLAGGILFGAGFVLGGYCPGTACAGAASGRIDALMMIIGMLLGSVASWFARDWLGALSSMTPVASGTLGQLLQLPWGVTVGLVAVLAAGAFVLVERFGRTLAR